MLDMGFAEQVEEILTSYKKGKLTLLVFVKEVVKEKMIINYKWSGEYESLFFPLN